MFGRRAHPRVLLGSTAQIIVNEHHTEPCMIYDRSVGGVRLILSNAEIVPDLFLLTIDGTDEVLVGQAIWRTAEEIGAKVSPPPSDQSEIRSLRR